jgi:RNA polymerase sigma factor (sigma-70 family)
LLITIAINHCRDYWKSSYYRHSKIQTEIDEWLTNEKTNVSYIFERKQNRELVRSLLQELPEFQKEVILLRYYHDMKLKEIATATNSKEATVKSRLRQGLGKLGELLKRSEKDESKTSKSKS